MSEDPLLAQRPTINPYARAAVLIRDRLSWDLNPESWRSRARLKAVQDTHPNGKAVILCNGPSLNKVNFDKLAGIYCFGLNKINLLFDRTDFRPNAIACVNDFVIEQNRDFYNTADVPLFLTRRSVNVVRPRHNVTFVDSALVPKFARDVSISLYEGFTVTFVALQIAFHMGFRHVALVGADHNFATSGPANQTVVSGAKDESHFDPNYFAGGVQWQLPDLFQSEVSYTLARDAYAAAGGQVVNATDGGKLEIFDRMGLEEFLSHAH